MKMILLKKQFPVAGYALFFSTLPMANTAIAQASDENVGSRLTAGRLESLSILLVGIVSVVLAWRAMKRQVRGMALLASAMGLVCVVFSGMHLAKTQGGFGTGGGKAGAIAAMLAGALGIILALITYLRTRKNSGQK